MSENNMWAVWKYDLYPYYLCGEVVNGPNDYGRVQVKGYATHRRDGTYGGGWFSPEILVSSERGKKLQAELSSLKAGMAHEIDLVRAKWNAKLDDVLPEKLRDN